MRKTPEFYSGDISEDAKFIWLYYAIRGSLTMW